mmetsp:Transcript_14069/g.11329  ORF Transcript_14069/g.11329 Transcript_14069/m.11329 type:complete len:85 (+) Transcript_14069:180-434(+)
MGRYAWCRAPLVRGSDGLSQNGYGTRSTIRPLRNGMTVFFFFFFFFSVGNTLVIAVMELSLPLRTASGLPVGIAADNCTRERVP